MFVDKAKINIKAGNGGNGCVSFRREKYVAKGGPDGGDGGKGGDVIFEVDEGLRTLVDFKYKSKYFAKEGKDGQGSNKSGKASDDLIIRVPPGTLVKDYETGKFLADLKTQGQRAVIAKGGKGGAGNQHFATSTRQIPSFSKPGEKGEEKVVSLQLKMLADVGLVGFPNAGKSTLLSVVSAARPKIADYPFTTIEPNLGVVKVDNGSSFVMADIPGLIEGAHEGIGLGHDFLKHIERTKLLLHIVDIAKVDGRNPIDDFYSINKELKEYSPKLSQREQVVVGNKVDICEKAEMENFKKVIENEGLKFFEISAATNTGVKELIGYLENKLRQLPYEYLDQETENENFVVVKEDKEIFTVKKDGNVYKVEGEWIHRLINSINFDDYESLQYFQRAIKKKGLSDKLEEMGIEEGDTVVLDDFEMEYIK